MTELLSKIHNKAFNISHNSQSKKLKPCKCMWHIASLSKALEQVRRAGNRCQLLLQLSHLRHHQQSARNLSPALPNSSRPLRIL
jgi:hypothetical protein